MDGFHIRLLIDNKSAENNLILPLNFSHWAIWANTFTYP